MKSLNDLIKDEEQIWFSIGDKKEQQEAFLKWAKQNNCAWQDREIDPQKDCCSVFMGIDKNRKLGYVGGHCWFEAKNSPNKIEFSKIMGE